MASPNLASRRWVWEQYDQSVGADTVQRPGGDAAVVRVHGSKKALAITTDCTPRYCYADPVEGGKQAVAEAYRNLCAVGAKPLAITNCLNFGNPQRPEIMGQFVGCVEGMAEACRALDFPVVSGNVSLYNETKNEDGTSLAILPTPAIGGVGLLDDWQKSRDDRVQGSGRNAPPSRPFDRACRPVACGSKYATAGAKARRHRSISRSSGASASWCASSLPRASSRAVHDVSDGGALVAIAEMALAGGFGASLSLPSVANPAAVMFGEDQGRVLVTTADADAVVARASASSLFAARSARPAAMLSKVLVSTPASPTSAPRMRASSPG